MQFHRSTLSRWISATVAACSLLVVGCGDNQGRDLRTPDVDSPSLPGLDEGDEVDGEFFIPGGGLNQPQASSRFVKNPSDPADLVFIPGSELGTGTYLWVAYDGSQYGIFRTDEHGGAATALAQMGYQPDNLVGDNNGLFWSEANKNKLYTHDSLNGVVINLYDFDQPITSITPDDDYLYVGTSVGDLIQTDRGQGQTRSLTTIGGTPSSLFRVGESLFATTYEGSLYEYSFEKGTTEEIVSGFDFSNGVAIDDSSIYWADSLGRQVLALDRFGGEPYGEPYVLAGAQYQVTSITSDRFYLYFSTAADNLIKAVPKQGGEVLTLGIGWEPANEMLLDSQDRLFTVTDENIYYISL